MVTGIIGRKLGMTQVFDPDGTIHPATVIKAGPCVVVQAKTAQTDGYESVQLGLVEEKPAKVGEQVLVTAVFNAGDQIDVIGVSRGHGFQGVVKRHHFAGGAATHGSMFHRAPGSIGASSYPSRVVKGMRAAGRMGGDRVTVRNLRVVKVDGDNHLLIVRGAVPGKPGGYVMIRKALAPRREPQPQAQEKPKKGKK